MNIKQRSWHRLVLLIIFFPSITLLRAQTISGKVIDEITSEPLAFVNVVLIRTADSIFIAGTTTNNDGIFLIKPPNENFFLRISLLGYKTLEINELITDEIRLMPDIHLLSEATVTATSVPKFRMEQGGISVNIQNSRFKELGTASEVLQYLPFVTKLGDSYSVFGKGTPLIYINNRLVRDFEELEELHSENIRKIIVITNPGAEYDAEIKAVIKIETVKLQGEGLSGSTSGSIIVDRKFSHNESINLNYRHKNLDIFGTFRFSQGRDLLNIDILQSDEVVLLNERLRRDTYFRGIRSTTGFNYSFNKDQSIGFKCDFKNIPTDFEKHLINMNIQNNNIPESNIHSIQDRMSNQNIYYLNTYYNGKPFSWMNVKFVADFSEGKTPNSQNTNNYIADSIQNIFTNGLQKYNLFATKIICETPLLEGILTYGYEYAYTINNQIFNVNEEGQTINLVPNNTIAKQNLHAPYIKYMKSLRNFSLEIGVRNENVYFNYFTNHEKNNEQSYISHNLFPNIALTYSKGSSKMMLSYRKVIRRPSYYELRNNIQYDNPYVYETGNPYLQPTIINNLSFLFHQKNFQLMADYDMQKNFIFLYPQNYFDNIVLYKPENIDKRRFLSISGSFSPTIDKWNPSIEIGFSKDFLRYGNLSQTYNQPVFNIDIENSISLFKNMQLGVDAYYSTNGNSGFYYLENNFRTNVYLSSTFFHQKIRINLKGNDLLNTDRIKRRLLINNISTYTNNDLNSRNITLSITYRFNATANKYKGEEASKELNRLQ